MDEVAEVEAFVEYMREELQDNEDDDDLLKWATCDTEEDAIEYEAFAQTTSCSCNVGVKALHYYDCGKKEDEPRKRYLIMICTTGAYSQTILGSLNPLSTESSMTVCHLYSVRRNSTCDSVRVSGNSSRCFTTSLIPKLVYSNSCAALIVQAFLIFIHYANS